MVDSLGASAYIKGMTYCVAIAVAAGSAFISDSRTHAGVDQISTYSKMHRFDAGAGRHFVLLSAGNLATAQSVVARMERDMEAPGRQGLLSADNLDQAAEYIGRLSVEEQQKHRQAHADKSFLPEASFILGGEISGVAPSILHIYAEGNFIRASQAMPYLQIGEIKYGRPLLDRIITWDTPLDAALKCALVSMDSTLRNNATVGPPIECFVLPAGARSQGLYRLMQEDDEYLVELRRAWTDNLRTAFDALPGVPAWKGCSGPSASVTRLEVS